MSGLMREVVVAQPLTARWKEIVVCTGEKGFYRRPKQILLKYYVIFKQNCDSLLIERETNRLMLVFY